MPGTMKSYGTVSKKKPKKKPVKLSLNSFNNKAQKNKKAKKTYG